MFAKSHLRLGIACAAALMLAGCGTMERISRIGKAPDLTPIENQEVPPSDRSFQPMVVPSVAQAPGSSEERNSLWQTGTRHFFKDPRASKIGDILTVLIDINDKAKVDNTTVRSRDNSNNAAISRFPGGLGKASDLVDLGSSTANRGSGSVNRSEAISLQIAAVVTQVLPNGNLVIKGHQEVRVNYEVRELTVMGIVRPEDIRANNTVRHSQIAEARVSYGGRGQITDLQQPPYGQQLYEILVPF